MYADYCPLYQSAEDCRDRDAVKGSRKRGEAHGPSSRCLDTTDAAIRGYMYHGHASGCYTTKCDYHNNRLRVRFGNTWLDCNPNGGTVDIPASAGQGSIHCPTFSSVCGVRYCNGTACNGHGACVAPQLQQHGQDQNNGNVMWVASYDTVKERTVFFSSDSPIPTVTEPEVDTSIGWTCRCSPGFGGVSCGVYDIAVGDPVPASDDSVDPDDDIVDPASGGWSGLWALMSKWGGVILVAVGAFIVLVTLLRYVWRSFGRSQEAYDRLQAGVGASDRDNYYAALGDGPEDGHATATTIAHPRGGSVSTLN
eukprot:GFYU01008391.1.p1 GENE.GFYU01008391.1~~GFYU01008391.1.p1  ORF type:complete len:309 (+),score=62.77 GFYU01008391.1:608-1534(+)